MNTKTLSKAVLLATTLGLTSGAMALDWQTNEIHYQYGEFDTAYSGGQSDHASVYTFQHASGWEYGDSFMFVDSTDSSDNGHDLYTEAYTNLSLGKITGNDLSMGIIKDVGIVGGVNWADDAKVQKFLPGVRLSLDVPGFSFLNVDMTGYIDNSKGVSRNGAPKEDDSYMIDVSWAYPVSFGDHDFSIEGHMEYIGERDNQFDQKVEGHFLAQPQVRYDLGKTLFNQKDKVFIGIEYQHWDNKLGDKETDERVIQALAVYRF